MGYANNVESLKPYELQALIDWFMYWLPMEKRGELMRQFPQIYNKLCGREIVSVCHTDNGDPVGTPRVTVVKIGGE